MWLNDVFSGGISNTSTTTSTGQSNGADGLSNVRINQIISGMKAGDTIQGEIISKNGVEITLQITDDLTMTARVEGDVNLELGKLLTLEVRSNSGGTLSLSPLFENTATDANVLKALDMAGLPTNAKTIEMTDSMMKNGMNVGKENLTEMFKDVVTNKDTSPTDIVNMHKLGIDVTRENVEQYNNYKNLNHQIVRGMTDVVNELSGTFQSMAASNDIEGAVALFDSLVSIVSPENAQFITSTATTTEALMDASLQAENPNPTPGSSDAVSLQARGDNSGETTVFDVTNSNPVVAANANDEGSPVQNVIHEQVSSVNRNILSGNENELSAPGIDNSTQVVISGGESSYQANSVNPQASLELLMEMYNQATTLEDKLTLFSSDKFSNALKDAIIDKWTLTPDSVRNKEAVEEMYNSLRNGLHRLSGLAESTTGTASQLTQTVNNLSNNVDFMNQLNHMYTYIQLPLKMANGEKTGDLYVYTNKHSLASKDGRVSAFLHLDMDNLGPVDVYVTMQDSKVNTNFKLKDEETLDFIEKHMYILNDRLEKRGYSLKCECHLKDDDNSAMEEMLKTDNMKIFGGHHSFDVRT